MRVFAWVLAMLLVAFPILDVLWGRWDIGRTLLTSGDPVWALVYFAAWALVLTLLLLDRIRHLAMRPVVGVHLRADPCGSDILSVRVSLEFSRKSIPMIRKESFPISVCVVIGPGKFVRRSATGPTVRRADRNGDAAAFYSFKLGQDEAAAIRAAPFPRAAVVASDGVRWDRGKAAVALPMQCPVEDRHAWIPEIEADNAAS